MWQTSFIQRKPKSLRKSKMNSTLCKYSGLTPSWQNAYSLALTFLLVCQCGCQVASRCESDHLSQIKSSLNRGEIDSIVIRRANYRLTSIIPINPTEFEKLTADKIRVQLDPSARLRFYEALAKTKVSCPHELESPDIRLGIYFLDVTGKTVHVIYAEKWYVNTKKRTALVDGQVYELKCGLLDCVEQLFDLNSQTNRTRGASKKK